MPKSITQKPFCIFAFLGIWCGMLAFLPDATIGGNDISRTCFFASYSRKAAASASVLNFLKFFIALLIILLPWPNALFIIFTSPFVLISLNLRQSRDRSFVFDFLKDFLNPLYASRVNALLSMPTLPDFILFFFRIMLIDSKNLFRSEERRVGKECRSR